MIIVKRGSSGGSVRRRSNPNRSDKMQVNLQPYNRLRTDRGASVLPHVWNCEYVFTIGLEPLPGAVAGAFGPGADVLSTASGQGELEREGSGGPDPRRRIFREGKGFDKGRGKATGKIETPACRGRNALHVSGDRFAFRRRSADLQI